MIKSMWIRWEVHIEQVGNFSYTQTYEYLAGKHKNKKLMGGFRSELVDNTKMYLKENVCHNVNRLIFLIVQINGRLF
jgi:hypothetical protein